MTNEAQLKEVLDFLNSIAGDGYGGMASFEIAKAYVEDALRAQSDVRAPAPQCEPVTALLDIRSLSQATRDGRCLEVWFARNVSDDDRANLLAAVNAFRASAAPPTDLAEVLENVRISIGKIADGRRGDGVPPELYRACHALAHMTKDLRS